MAENDPGEGYTRAVIGFSGKYYVRMVAKLMVLRFAVKKSLMRVIRKRVLPKPPGVFIRRDPLFFSLLESKKYFNNLKPDTANSTNLLFSFLISKLRNKNLLKSHFGSFGSLFRKNLFVFRSAKKVKFARARHGKKNFLSLKKKYFLFKKQYLFWRNRIKRIARNRTKRSFRKGYYNLKKFFTRLRRKKKGFKHESVSKAVRAGKNRLTRGFIKYKRNIFLKEKFTKFCESSHDLFDPLFKGIMALISFLNPSQLKLKRFLLVFVLRKIGRRVAPRKALRAFKGSCAPFLKIFPFIGLKIKKSVVFKLSPLHLKRFYKLLKLLIKKKLGAKIVKKSVFF